MNDKNLSNRFYSLEIKRQLGSLFSDIFPDKYSYNGYGKTPPSLIRKSSSIDNDSYLNYPDPENMKS
ncbi:MAG: hypothetical protein FH751_00255 [Firmicutes bacterium]|nr:hypothetical protein [Bacillota bacterium]